MLGVTGSGVAIRARYSEDGKWYDATLQTAVGGQYLVNYTEYDEQELVDLTDVNVEEAWLIYEYSPVRRRLLSCVVFSYSCMISQSFSMPYCDATYWEVMIHTRMMMSCDDDPLPCNPP